MHIFVKIQGNNMLMFVKIQWNNARQPWLRQCHMYDVRCMMSDMVYGVWCMVYGIYVLGRYFARRADNCLATIFISFAIAKNCS